MQYGLMSEQGRKRGLRSFIVRRGILGVGLPAMVMLGVTFYGREFGYSLDALRPSRVALTVVLSAVFAVILGVVWGSLYWAISGALENDGRSRK